MANVKREILMILRVPSYAVNILPIAFMPLLIVIMMGVMFNKIGRWETRAICRQWLKLNPPW